MFKKVVTILSDDSESFDCTLTQDARTVYLSFESEEKCDAFIASLFANVEYGELERSDDHIRNA